ncbi:GLPGLI family protein [Chryseobacterium angstadtii]|uniref:GLPGLI family protein n=1 Tax=Chryseobacterium angstadtii TaxID=558151 RepID=UPI00065AA8D0|nr:GLPGLI family protein [Chryseobacterium angstadtii]
MKRKLIVFFLLILATVTYGQTMRYIYDTAVNPDSINLVRMKHERTFLDIKGDRSSFISENKLIRDSLQASFRAEDKEDYKKREKDLKKLGTKKDMEPAFFENYIIKSISQQKVYYYDKVAGREIYYQEDRPLKWEIADAKENQNGYSVQKAVTNFGGRVWTAWFTKDINISDGPYKFSGLPGLIVKLEDENGDYKFDLVKKIKVQNAFEKPSDPNAKQSTRIEFNGDKAALQLEAGKNRRLSTGAGKEGMGFDGSRHGGMRGDRMGGDRGMPHAGGNNSTFSVPNGGSGDSSLRNSESQNPIELK